MEMVIVYIAHPIGMMTDLVSSKMSWKKEEWMLDIEINSKQNNWTIVLIESIDLLDSFYPKNVEKSLSLRCCSCSPICLAPYPWHYCQMLQKK